MTPVAQNTDRNHCHYIGIDTGVSVEHPEKDGHCECNPNDICLGIRLSGILYLEFNLVR